MRVLSLFAVNWYQECFGVTVDSPRQSIVYNRYATLIFTNPVFLGFSRYANVNFGSQRDNSTEYYKNIKPLGNPVFSRGFFIFTIQNFFLNLGQFLWVIHTKSVVMCKIFSDVQFGSATDDSSILEKDII